MSMHLYLSSYSSRTSTGGHCCVFDRLVVQYQATSSSPISRVRELDTAHTPSAGPSSNSRAPSVLQRGGEAPSYSPEFSSALVDVALDRVSGLPVGDPAGGVSRLSKKRSLVLLVWLECACGKVWGGGR